MIVRHRDRRKEWVRNFFFIVIAIGTVVAFFNLDIIRNKSGSGLSKSAEQKLNFRGELDRKDFSSKELARLIKYTNQYNDIFKSVTIETSSQDTYKKITPTTEILFEVHIVMNDGTTLSTPLRRTQRKDLVPGIITKLVKDMRAYKAVQKEGTKVKSLINTM